METSTKQNDPVRQGNELRTYSRFKQKFTYKIYVDFNKNYRKRQIITKIRCSAHIRLEKTGKLNLKVISVNSAVPMK